MSPSRILQIFLAFSLITALTGCAGDDDPGPAPPPTSTPPIVLHTATPTPAPPATGTATLSPTPSATALPTQTTEPIDTAEPTPTSAPTETPTPGATPTATVDPTELAAAGEQAFFDTLYGRLDREAESIALLGAAVAANPNDGRSFFLLGMMHLYRVGQSLTDYTAPSPLAVAEAPLARAALDSAVPLSVEDRRVPGFRGAATYLNGVIAGDDELRALGLVQLRDAIELYPDFNNFSFLGAVAPVVARDDPLFLESVELVRLAIAGGCGPASQPEICGNAGKAPHNVQGAMMMFGDVYAKAGDRNQALAFYNLGLGLEGAGTWPFRAAMEQRIDEIDDRIARWVDGDPSNDPPFAGNGREACAICHFE
jgi:hypothetical protein